MTHQEIGELAARLWGLPASYCSPIRYHHTPLDAPAEDRHLVTYTHVADIVASAAGFSIGPKSQEEMAMPFLAGSLGIPEAQWEPIRATVARQVEAAMQQVA
jgi:HD-like signal output (HDOD) protein